MDERKTWKEETERSIWCQRRSLGVCDSNDITWKVGEGKDLKERTWERCKLKVGHLKEIKLKIWTWKLEAESRALLGCRSRTPGPCRMCRSWKQDSVDEFVPLPPVDCAGRERLSAVYPLLRTRNGRFWSLQLFHKSKVRKTKPMQ